jgi:predicted GH43/DUF377 family glycosyl hydrolase
VSAQRSAHVVDTGIRLEPDPSRVVTRLFVPGREEVGPGESRAAPVIERVLAASETEIHAAALAVVGTLSGRHDGIGTIIEANVEQVLSRLDPLTTLSPERRLVLGACFTHEYAIEAAAFCNPSIVLAPGESDGGSGTARFVLSARSIGEGHRSSIAFRSGSVSSTGEVIVDEVSPFAVTAQPGPGLHHRASMELHLSQFDDDGLDAAFVLDGLPDVFDDDRLGEAMDDLRADSATRGAVQVVLGHVREHAAASYCATFPAGTEVSSRVLWPHAQREAQGMEDARFVRFLDDTGVPRFLATYSAWDGVTVTQQMLETADFLTFYASPVAGAAAVGKGLALFPRQIDGRYAALSRSDRETNAVSFSDDIRCWTDRHVVQTPRRPWEMLQLGNCGSPIETDRGWLVLTHGVGPLRTYHIGAILLDLDDPTVMLAASHDPVLSPTGSLQDGYVPNVVYTCGALAHGDVLVLPFGIGDRSIGIATVSIDDLLESLTPACMSAEVTRMSHSTWPGW